MTPNSTQCSHVPSSPFKTKIALGLRVHVIPKALIYHPDLTIPLLHLTFAHAESWNRPATTWAPALHLPARLITACLEAEGGESLTADENTLLEEIGTWPASIAYIRNVCVELRRSSVTDGNVGSLFALAHAEVRTGLALVWTLALCLLARLALACVETVVGVSFAADGHAFVEERSARLAGVVSRRSVGTVCVEFRGCGIAGVEVLALRVLYIVDNILHLGILRTTPSKSRAFSSLPTTLQLSLRTDEPLTSFSAPFITRRARRIATSEVGYAAIAGVPAWVQLGGATAIIER
jgi:hypothetical protein